MPKSVRLIRTHQKEFLKCQQPPGRLAFWAFFLADPKVCLSENVKSYKHGSEEGGAVALKDWLLLVPLLLAVEPRAL